MNRERSETRQTRLEILTEPFSLLSFAFYLLSFESSSSAAKNYHPSPLYVIPLRVHFATLILSAKKEFIYRLHGHDKILSNSREFKSCSINSINSPRLESSRRENRRLAVARGKAREITKIAIHSRKVLRGLIFFEFLLAKLKVTRWSRSEKDTSCYQSRS